MVKEIDENNDGEIQFEGARVVCVVRGVPLSKFCLLTIIRFLSSLLCF